VRKPAAGAPVLDLLCINENGNSSLESSISIEESPVTNTTTTTNIPVVHITDSADEPVNNTVVTEHIRTRSPSDPNLLGQPKLHEIRARSGSFSHTAGTPPAHKKHGHHHHHHHHNVLYTSSGAHLMVHHPRAQVAEPPVATSKEVATARLKLWSSDKELNL